MSPTAGARFERLVEIMHTLRSPGGCPWDREQTFATLRPYVLEETCELLDAIDAGDLGAMREELGDVLLEVVFVAELAGEAGHFTIADSIRAITEKLIRRHPHVFAPDGRRLADAPDITPTAVKAKWDDIKADERSTAGKPAKPTFAGIPRALPALQRANELSRRAAGVGFDWSRAGDVLDKIDEEARELRAAVAADGTPSAAAEEELGDMLFAVANLARKLDLDPEAALRRANDKFQARFEHMERDATERGERLSDLSAAELDARWNVAKLLTGNTKGTKDTKDGTKQR